MPQNTAPTFETKAKRNKPCWNAMHRDCLRHILFLCLCCQAIASCGAFVEAALAEDLGLSDNGVVRDTAPGLSPGNASRGLLRLRMQENAYIGAENIDALNATLEQIPEMAPADALTLNQACRLAIEKHPLVESARASKLEAEADYGIAKSVYYPRIDLQSQVGPSHDLDASTTNYGEGGITVRQTLYNFGGLQDGIDSAELKALSAQLRYVRTEEDIAALVTNAYLTVLQARELVTVYENSLEFYDKLLETFWERYNAGISSRADSQKVKVSKKAAESQLTVQNQQLSTAKNLLENIIEEPVERVDTSVDVMNVAVKGSIDESYEVALKNNVSLRAYRAEIMAQKKVIESRHAEYLPSFGYRLQAKNELQDIDGYKQSLDAQLTLNWNLFNGFATDERIRKENAILKRMVATKEATELEIRNILSDAYNAYWSSEKEFELAKEAYDSSVYLMGLYLSEFDLGIRTLLDLITAREGQTSAAVREVNARYARIRSILNIVLEEGRLQTVLNLPTGITVSEFADGEAR